MLYGFYEPVDEAEEMWLEDNYYDSLDDDELDQWYAEEYAKRWDDDER